MIGLMIIGFFALYLLISAFVVGGVTGWAKKHGRSAWKWGGLAAFVMYNLVFWDLVPTLVAHKYYCETKAGFWVYKTPEQWQQENPGVAETLDRKLEPKSEIIGGIQRFWLTQRFFNDVTRTVIFHSLSRTEDTFYDAQTGAIIAHSVNYFRGRSGNVFGLGGTPDELRQAIVLGWGNRQCEADGKSPTDSFNKYIYQFWKWGEKK